MFVDLDAVVARLRGQCPSFENRVGGAAEYEAAVEEEDLAVPCAFVIALQDEAEGNQTAGSVDVTVAAVTQVLVESLAVVVVVDNTADLRGYAAKNLLDPVRREVMTALLGWQPASEFWPMQYAEGGLQDMRRHRLWWQLIYETAEVLQQPQ